MSETAIWPWVMIAGLVLVGCGGKDDAPMQTTTASSDDGVSSTSGSPVTTTNAPSDTTSTTTATTGGSGSSGGGQDSGNTGVVFLQEPDFCCDPFECNLFEQDCPVGEKCMPYADDGGGSWNSTTCSPVMENPGQRGDECSVEGSGGIGRRRVRRLLLQGLWLCKHALHLPMLTPLHLTALPDVRERPANHPE